MQIKLKLSQKVLILVTVPILVMLSFVTTLAMLQKNAEEAIWRERHFKDGAFECNSLITNFVSAGSDVALYLATREKYFLDQFDELAGVMPLQIRTLKQFLKDSPDSINSLRELDSASNDAIESLHRARWTLGRYNLSDVPEGQIKQDLGTQSAKVIQMLRTLVKEQQALGAQNSLDEEQARYKISGWLIAGLVISVVLAVVSAVLFNKSTTRRLLVLVNNTERLGARKELLPRQGGSDEIARLDDVFHQMAQSLEEAAQRKQELMSIVAHDLRTPLTSIQGSLTLLGEKALGDISDKAMLTVAIAEKNTTHLIRLINDLLDFDKFESGKLEFEFKPVVVEELFERAQEVVSEFARQKNIRVEFSATDIVINGDSDRLTQVLVNLLSNAVKFSPEGSAVEMSAERGQKKDYVEIRVKDSGRGIPQELLQTVFERYEQVKREDSKKGFGSGLGLSICKAFVEAHHGSIGVESQPGVGSTFWFRLPT